MSTSDLCRQSGIGEILRPESVFCGVSCASKKSLLDTAARFVAELHEPVRQADVFDCLCVRERLGSTGLGHGIALPHGRLPDGGGNGHDDADQPDSSPFSPANKNVLTAFLTLSEPIDYGAVDSLPVDLVFVLVTPEQSTDEHLRILALLVEKLSNEQLAKSLRACKSPAEAYQLLAAE